MMRVFLDANIYFCGFFSKEGASAFILRLAQKEKVKVVATALVLLEANRNLHKKGTASSLRSFHEFLKEGNFERLPPPSQKFCQQFHPMINEKDLPIFAAAAQAKVDYFITLDRKGFFTPRLNSFALPIQIILPGDFLRVFCA